MILLWLFFAYFCFVKAKFMRLLYYFFFTICLFAACTTFNAEEDFPPDPCTNAAATYKLDVSPIIQQYCFRCHDTDTRFGGVFLERYSDVADYASNGSLMGVMRAINGYSVMPPDGVFMLECDILTVEQWIAEGAQNN